MDDTTNEIGMKPFELSTHLNIAFALVLFVPMLVAAVFSIAYFSRKIQEDAIQKIDTDLKMAVVTYQGETDEIMKTAVFFAQKKEIISLLTGNTKGDNTPHLKQLPPSDRADMITVLNREGIVVARLHAPKKMRDKIQDDYFPTQALKGNCVSGTQILTRKDIGDEGLDEIRVAGIQGKALVMSGSAPIYRPETGKIVGAAIVRRIIDWKSEIVKKISDNLNVNCAIFEHNRLVALAVSEKNSGDFMLPAAATLDTVLTRNSQVHIADISKGGSISNCLPIRDFQGQPVGILMVQAGVDEFLRTRKTAILILLLILFIGFILAFSIKSVIEKKIGKYHSMLENEIMERRKAETRIRNLTRMLIFTQERERKRISFDLHDDAMQKLSMVLLRYETLFHSRFTLPEEIDNQVKELNEILRAAIQSIRNISYGLRPSSLDQFGIEHSLKELSVDFTRETGIPVDFKSTGLLEDALDSDMRINIYRLVQEALNNVRKHSGATHVSVKIVSSYPKIILRIQDNGKGFHPDAISEDTVSQKKMGIQSMEERVKLLNGSIGIDSSPGNGTKIHISFLT